MIQCYCGDNMKYENIKTPEELFQFMEQNIKYGVKDDDGNIYDGWDNEESSSFQQACATKWKFSNAQTIIEKGYGHCFDQTELERDWFSNNNYEYKTFFSYYNGEFEYPCHTFLVFKDKNEDNWYWFEHASYSNRGIHKFDNLESALEEQRKRSIEFANYLQPISEEAVKSYTLLEYEKPNYGINNDEFLTKIITYGEEFHLNSFNMDFKNNYQI